MLSQATYCTRRCWLPHHINRTDTVETKKELHKNFPLTDKKYNKTFNFTHFRSIITSHVGSKLNPTVTSALVVYKNKKKKRKEKFDLQEIR